MSKCSECASVPPSDSSMVLHDLPYLQNQSPLFSHFPKEIRDEIYSDALALSHHIHVGRRYGWFDNSCPTQYLYAANCTTGCDKLDLPIPRHRAALLMTCRRIYDEGRRILYKENSFILGPSYNSNLAGELRRFVAAISIHRGKTCPAIPVGNFIFALGDDDAPGEAYCNVNAVAWALYRVPTLRIDHLSFVSFAHSFDYADDANSLCIVLKRLRKTKTCKVFGIRPKPANRDDRSMHKDIKSMLKEAALSDPDATELDESSLLNPNAKCFTPTERLVITPMQLAFWARRSAAISQGFI